jgi:hypothetical protein
VAAELVVFLVVDGGPVCVCAVVVGCIEVAVVTLVVGGELGAEDAVASVVVAIGA